MAENQQLKHENDKLKSEVSQFRDNLNKEKENNEKITKEVVRYLQPQNQQNYPMVYHQPMPPPPPPMAPYYPYAYPPHHPPHPPQQSYSDYATARTVDSRGHRGYDIHEVRDDQQQQQQHHQQQQRSQQAPNKPIPRRPALRKSTTPATLPDVVQPRRQPREMVRQAHDRSRFPTRAGRDSSASRIPRYSASSSRMDASYERLDQIDQRARKDIEEINRQIQKYKKLNRTQR